MVLECVSVHCFEDLDVRGCLACSSGKQNETETYVPVIKDGKYIVARKTNEMKERRELFNLKYIQSNKHNHHSKFI